MSDQELSGIASLLKKSEVSSPEGRCSDWPWLSYVPDAPIVPPGPTP